MRKIFAAALFTAGLFAGMFASMATADAQYQRRLPGLGGGGYYYQPRPMPRPQMVPRYYQSSPYPQGYPYYNRRGNLGGIPGQTAGPTCVYIRNGVCYFY